ncbi:hypothetical protein F7732_09960 [Bacillus mesophilum]|uniref:Uncharacterized protein n=1 Tax=Bacillus mesophilum TaxID=1071718 RepID=A0A7V7UV06_9BACI|nr:hypothetical protein F7732_09960 [Bacillus mesophilum]
MLETGLKNRLYSLLERSGSKAIVQFEAFFPGERFAGGKYHIGTHTITLYLEEIKGQCLQLFSSLDFFNEYIEIVFAHEIGHAEDRNLLWLADQLDLAETETERLGIALQIEENAWNFAENVIGSDNELFQVIKTHSLQPYRDQLLVGA